MGCLWSSTPKADMDPGARVANNYLVLRAVFRRLPDHASLASCAAVLQPGTCWGEAVAAECRERSRGASPALLCDRSSPLALGRFSDRFAPALAVTSSSSSSAALPAALLPGCPAVVVPGDSLVPGDSFVPPFPVEKQRDAALFLPRKSDSAVIPFKVSRSVATSGRLILPSLMREHYNEKALDIKCVVVFEWEERLAKCPTVNCRGRSLQGLPTCQPRWLASLLREAEAAARAGGRRRAGGQEVAFAGLRLPERPGHLARDDDDDDAVAYGFILAGDGVEAASVALDATHSSPTPLGTALPPATPGEEEGKCCALVLGSSVYWRPREEEEEDMQIFLNYFDRIFPGTPALGILPRRPCLTFGRTASTVAAGARETEWSSPFGWECANCREGSTVLAVLLLFRFK